MATDFYETLGLKKGASDAEIKKAYRKLAKEHHPDKGGDAERFKEINNAYETLKDPQKKAAYDQFGQAGAQFGGTGAGGFSGFSDFNAGNFQGAQFDFSDLGDIFGNMFGGGNAGFDPFGASTGQHSERTRAGHNLQMVLEISFLEMAFGVEKTLDLERLVKCESCGGAGGKTEKCARCGGAGHIEAVRDTILGRVATTAPCPDCGGTGHKITEKCAHCHGEGRLRQHAPLTVKVPAGIEDGATLRVRGAGEAGARGAVAGDLYLKIRVAPDDYFTRDGKNIFTKNAISVTTAVLGGELRVRTLSGEKIIKIPAGTQPGKSFVLRGAGLSPKGSLFAGDHLVEIQIEIPTKISKKERELWEKLRD